MASHRTTLSLAGAATAATLLLSACGGVSTSTGGSDDGGSYPSGTVEMYVGADPGGSSDLISRQVSTGLSDALDASFPVINASGANGALAAAEVASAEPDGSTIAVQNASLFAITPLAVAEDEVTSIDDFEVVGGVSRDDYVLVTNADSEYQTIEDLEGADSLKYGTTGVGTGSQVAQALLFGDLGVDATDVPFDGGAPALTAVLGGQVDAAALQIGEAIENIEAGKLTPLTVFGPERVESLPDVETATEQGLEVEVSQYRFLTVPAGTPQDVIDTLAGGLEETFATEEYQAFNEQNNLAPLEVSGDEVVTMLEEDGQRYADLLDEYGISLGSAS